MKLAKYLCSMPVLGLIACSGDDDGLQSQSSTKALRSPSVAASLRGVSDFTGARGALTALRDEPAAALFADVDAAVVGKRSLSGRLGVYQIAVPADANARVKQRSRELFGAVAAVKFGRLEAEGASGPTPLFPNAVARKGTLEIRHNAFSGAEFLVDKAKFHKGAPVAKLPFADEEYVRLADSYTAEKVGLSGPGVARNELFTYKVQRYMNSFGRTGEKPSVPQVEQVRVILAHTVDDLPTIGPGGKVVVHMAPSGEVVAHEQSLRAVSGRTDSISDSDLVSPANAEIRATEGVRARGIDPARFVVARRELGYFLSGRNSIQTVMVPQYAFVLDPKPGIVAKRLVEVIPATNNPKHLALLAADEAAERARKAAVAANAGADTPRGGQVTSGEKE